jgi:CO/xanthine dehydrogenase FAD-binding subunit
MRSYLPDYDLVIATDLPHALGLLSSGDGWRPMAGGTDLMVLLNAGRLPYRRLVSIAKLAELSAITISPEAVTIGAAVTFSQIQREPVLQTEFPLLCQAASWTGGIANQNRGTLGGNIVNASPAADTPPALLVYDAEVELVSERGPRCLPYSRFHTGYKLMELQSDELLSTIRLSRQHRQFTHYARKVGARRAQAISKVCFNALAEVDSSVIKHIRVGLGSVAPVPLRCQTLEAALLGQTVTSTLIAHAREVIAQEIQPIDDIRSTARYRSLVVQNLLSEFLGHLYDTRRT